MSFDYFEPLSGIVFRVESSITLDEIVNNTRKVDWVDESDVMRWSIGIDAPAHPFRYTVRSRSFNV